MRDLRQNPATARRSAKIGDERGLSYVVRMNGSRW
jgi:hypothetical protein